MKIAHFRAKSNQLANMVHLLQTGGGTSNTGRAAGITDASPLKVCARRIAAACEGGKWPHSDCLELQQVIDTARVTF